MRKILLLVLVLGLLSVARPVLTQLTHQEIKAEDFIQYITIAEPYRQWQTWPDKDKLYKPKSSEGHGALITTYVNRVALQSIGAKKGMANRSIIVVENYTADKKLAGLTTMYKVAGYNPDAGDWYWVEATAKGKVIQFGTVRSCIDCHRARASNDYIWAADVVGAQ